MKLRARLEKLQHVVANRPPPGQLEMVVAVPFGCGMAFDQPPGVHFNVDGRCATVVFEGPEPDPAIMEPLRARLVPWGSTIVSHPG